VAHPRIVGGEVRVGAHPRERSFIEELAVPDARRKAPRQPEVADLGGKQRVAAEHGTAGEPRHDQDRRGDRQDGGGAPPCPLRSPQRNISAAA